MTGSAAVPLPEPLPFSDPGSSRPPVSDWMRWNDVALTPIRQHTALRVEVLMIPHGSTQVPDDVSDEPSVG